MAETEDEQYRVVRIFPDYGHSSIWFADAYPFDYEECAISAELRASFEVWEQFYYRHVGYSSQRLPTRLAEYNDQGRRLARQLADEIGPGFEVECSSPEATGTTRFSASGPARNTAAAAAFARVREESRADDLAMRSRLADGRERGRTYGWTAHSPKTGEDFSNPS
ncbi:MAG TPA: hypothetical protein VHZ81_11345 [Galbitalea sp.]|jgi:hypothetical protein|nr:hypothetical protein [Galbitalea sp.]